MFEPMLSEIGLFAVLVSMAIVFAGGFVKGAIGFALPMIAVSGMGSFLPAETTVAAIILPILFSNTWQSLRQGFSAALGTLSKYWRLNLTLLISIYASAQMVSSLSDETLFVAVGALVTVFGATQLLGWRPYLSPGIACRIEPFVGIAAGVFGGFSGIWGPPILLYLIARGTSKTEQVRIQGISFLVGSIILTGAHLRSGTLDAVTLPFSALLVIPATVGMVVGFRLHDRLDQELFRRVTLLVLLLAGLNLLRRGFFG